MLLQPRRWLWGLLPMALAAGGSLWWKQADIEADLASRAQQAISRSSTVDGKPWAEIVVRGRDVVIAGTGPSGEALGAAEDTAEAQSGVRRADARPAALLRQVETFGWSARREGNALTLSGHVAPDGSRAQLLEAARRLMPDVEVTDLMEVVRGGPSTALGAGLLGLQQLARVTSGSATLTGSAFTFTGTAADAATRAAIAHALSTLPQGIERRGINLAIARPDGESPAMSDPGPFSAALPVPPPPDVVQWSASRGTDGILTLSGMVGSEAIRARLLEAAMAATTGPVVDAMTLVEGLPEAVEAQALSALGHLRRLASGTVAISGSALSVRGTAENAEALQALSALAGRGEGGLTAGELAIAPPLADPFTWRARRAGNALTLSGNVPSEAERSAVVEAARAIAGGAPVVDEMRLASGLPQGVDFTVVTRAALAQLGRLAEGAVQLSNARLTLTGRVPDFPTALGIRQAMAALGAPVTATVDITLPPAEIPPPPAVPDLSPDLVAPLPPPTPPAPATPTPASPTPATAPATTTPPSTALPAQRAAASVAPAAQAPSPLTPPAPASPPPLVILPPPDMPPAVELSARELAPAPQAAAPAPPLVILPLPAMPPAVELPASELQPPAPPQPLVILPLPDMPPTVELSASELQPPAPPAPPAAAPPAAAAPARPPGEIPPPPAPAPVMLPGPDCSVIIQTALEGDRILFDYWKAEKRAEHEAVLDRLAAGIRRCEPQERIEVAGHADIHNRTNQNQKLSEERAGLMRDELVRRGVPADMLVVVGYAETRPVVPNDTEDNRALNRRVEFHVQPRR
ncbi:OmpA family protein [Phreatobacter sp.]|uniref:OmpA family protein n=1 Tax=Phreatobacter sp. TaxID=1966341 RepID=UPI003F6F5E41